MNKITRRRFLQLSLASAASSSFIASPFIHARANKHVVVVGGGIAGSTAAKYIRRFDADIQVTLIEPKARYTTCFMSNEYLAGERRFETLQFGYSDLQKRGITVIRDTVLSIDSSRRLVTTTGGTKLSYDRCIVAPGIDFIWDAIEGYDKAIADSIPHAYQAGPQTQLLRKQLEAMPNGGKVIIAAPANPFRCPPAPYERASQIAHYLKQHKPRSKILILDAKDKFSKQKLFEAGWQRHYGFGTSNSLIEWVSLSNGGQLESLDASKKSVATQGDTYKADVINIIPPQKAGALAFSAGLTDNSGWCPIDQRSFESRLHKNIHVLGDSAMASPLPKSGYAANSEAKVCAAAVVSLLNDKDLLEPSFINTCYSILAPGDAISVAMVYGFENNHIIKMKGAGGLTPMDASDQLRQREAAYAHSWFNNITTDVFG